ncbi:MAG: hypothetical protein QOD90_1761 [Mycobacterium sp.]|jgi:hypothetical protein|nr:hypothetical protein [Mycobacterium sp.]
MKVLLAVTLAVGIALGAAPPAVADESTYLNQLGPRLAFLTTDQLLTEGYKVCRYLSVGRPSPDAIPVVMKDLQVTVAAAVDITAGAIEQLDC